MTYNEHKRASQYRKPREVFVGTYALTAEDYQRLTEESPCVYCGNPAPNRIDRVDPMIGYVPSNCVASCLRCNSRKTCFEHLGVEEAIEKTKALAHRNAIPPPSKREWRAGIHTTWNPRIGPKKEKPMKLEDWAIEMREWDLYHQRVAANEAAAKAKQAKFATLLKWAVETSRKESMTKTLPKMRRYAKRMGVR